MTLDEVSALLEKIKRIQGKLGSLDGDGFEWNLTHDVYGYQEYSVEGVKKPEELQDEIENGFIWLWSLKDYVRKFSLSHGKNPNWIERQIDNLESLSLCADIANSLKHGGLDRKPRSGKNPILSQVSYEMPQDSISKLSFYARRVEFVVSDPSKVKVSLDIIDNDNNKLGNAFTLINECLVEWENLIEQAQA